MLFRGTWRTTPLPESRMTRNGALKLQKKHSRPAGLNYLQDHDAGLGVSAMILSFVRFILGLFRKGWQPVRASQAYERSTTCAFCPNRNPQSSVPLSIVGTFAVAAMRLRRPSSEVGNIRTVDGVCGECGCYLAAKVWVPDSDIRRTTKPGQFPSFCWQHQAHNPVDSQELH